MNEEVQFDLNFTDTTILEANGEYSEVKELFKKEKVSKDWCLKSDLTIDSVYGIAKFKLDFYHDGKILIIEYEPSVGDVFYNPDIQALSEWAQGKGWNVPEPSVFLVKGNVEFWKHYWQTLLVDSPYLDKIFGERENLNPSEEEKEENDLP